MYSINSWFLDILRAFWKKFPKRCIEVILLENFGKYFTDVASRQYF